MIVGKNKLNPNLGANGAGKSSLFESLYWALFGKCSGGARSTSVQNKNNKTPTKVEIKTTIGEISRERPNLLKLNNKIVKNLDINEELFKSACYFHQDGVSFIDFGPKDRLDVISNLLGLEVWSQSSNNAATKLTEFQSSVKILDSRAQSNKRIKELILETLNNIQQQESTVDRKISNRKKELESKIKALGKGQTKTAIEKDPDKLKKEISAIEHKIYSLENKQGAITADKRTQTAVIQKVSASVGKICEFCKKEIDWPTDIDEEKNKLNRISNELSKITVDKSKEQEKRKEKIQQLRDSEEQRNELAKAEKEREFYTRELSLVLERGEEDKKGLKCLSSAEEAKLTNNETEAKKIKKDKAMYEGLVEQAKFWSNEFKNIRLKILDNTLELMAIDATNINRSLGNSEEIHFSTFKENNKTNKLDINIKKDGLEYTLEALSGGERQRIRLSVLIAFCNLINRKTNFGNFEIYDEQTNWLSHEGVTSFVSMLSSRAKEHNKAIFLIDHRSLNSGDFDAVVQVEKDEHGSKITETML